MLDEQMWQAVQARDAAADGRYVKQSVKLKKLSSVDTHFYRFSAVLPL